MNAQTFDTAYVGRVAAPSLWARLSAWFAGNRREAAAGSAADGAFCL